jgi:hypothetical protein
MGTNLITNTATSQRFNNVLFITPGKVTVYITSVLMVFKLRIFSFTMAIRLTVALSVSLLEISPTTGMVEYLTHGIMRRLSS